MATAYTTLAPRPPGVPSNIVVHLTAMRDDGKPLTREELEALSVAYPPPTAEGRSAVDAAIAAAAPSPASKKAHAGTKAKKPAPKRAAAKRPVSR